METTHPKSIAVMTQPSFRPQSKATWDSQYNILSVDTRPTTGKYLNAPYYYALEGVNAIQIVMQASGFQEVLLVEILGARWQINHEQLFPPGVENRGIFLSPDSWLPMRNAKRNRSYYIDLQNTLTFSVDPNYKVFKISFVQEAANKTLIFAASPHLVYSVSPENILQEMWISLMD